MILVARRREALDAIAGEARTLGAPEHRVVAMDLAGPDGAEALEREVDAMGIPVDLLVNNAGFGDFGPYLELDGEREGAMIHLNVTVLVELSRRFGARMAARGTGRILNVASTAGFQPGPLMTTYYATKAFVASYSEGLRNELAELGVTVTTLCPGPTRSGFQERSGMRESRFFQVSRLPAAAEVAEFGIRAALAGKGLVIHGWRNRMAAFLVRLTPRSRLPGIVRKILERRR